MAYQPHYIAQYDENSGLNTYYEPFILPEKAFPVLEDAICFRGRVKKREGFRLLGRLRRKITHIKLTNQANGAAYAVADILADAAINLRTTEPNAEIQASDVLAVQMVINVGALTFTDNGDGTLSGPGLNTGTINYITGALTLSFNPALGVATDVFVTFYYYTALPAMGISQLDNDSSNKVNDERTILFDTKYAYEYNAGLAAYTELSSTTPTTWNGTDSDFFWTTNYQKFFFATNFNGSGGVPDPLRFYNLTTWANYIPAITNIPVPAAPGADAQVLYTCLCIVPYKSRLLAFNIWEATAHWDAGLGQTTYLSITQAPQRMRFSNKGSINLTTIPDAWDSVTPGKGGFIDIPVGESIVSVEFIKDILVVKCETSSWKCVYTGNEILPFVFQKINTELGAESTFSLVPFDNGIYSVGNVGITTDDGVNVQRIDLQIPEYVFNFNNDFQGVKRIHGIRDYFNELVYWCYPSSQTNSIYPNKVLVYNYRNNSYSVYNDSFTCFGYFQRQADLRWSDLNVSWESYNVAWQSGATQSLFPSILGGNQQGYIEELFQQVTNEPYLSITKITQPIVDADPVVFTVPNNNFQDGDIIFIDHIIGVGPSSLNGFSYRVTIPSPLSLPDEITIEQFDGPLHPGEFWEVSVENGNYTPGTYLGGGQILFLQNINITSKVFAPFYEQGNQCRLGYIDFLLDQTVTGEVITNIFVDETTSNPINDASPPSLNEGLNGTNVLLTSAENLDLLPNQVNQKKIWHRQFVQSICQNFQVQITMTDEQRADLSISNNPFSMHAMALYLSPNARMTQ